MFISILIILMYLGSNAKIYAADIIGTKIADSLKTDIVTYVNGNYIPSYNVDGNIVVMCHQLNNYGFIAKWDSVNRVVEINAIQDYVGNLAVKLTKNKVTNNYFPDVKYIYLENVYYNLETKKYETEKEDIYVSEYPTYGGESVKGVGIDFLPLEYPTKLLIGTVLKGIQRYITVDQSKEMISTNYEADLVYFYSATLLKQSLALEAKNPTKYTSLADELSKNKNVPLKCTKIEVSNNSIGIPEITLSLKNLSSKQIKAFEVSFKCYDDFGRNVNRYLGNSNTFYGITQNRSISSGETNWSK